VKFHQPWGHHHQVGGHGVAADELAQGSYHFLYLQGRRRVLDDVEFIGTLGFLGPLPCVGEGLYLGGGIFAGLFAEQDVVGCVGVEGRIQINEVNGLVGNVFPKNGKVVTVVEGVGGSDVIGLRSYRWLLPVGGSNLDGRIAQKGCAGTCWMSVDIGGPLEEQGPRATGVCGVLRNAVELG
jgi:hypothetical protein